MATPNIVCKKNLPYVALIFFAVILSFYKLPRFFFSQDDFEWLYFAKFKWSDLNSLLTIYHGSLTPVINVQMKIFLLWFGQEAGYYHLMLVLFHFINSCLVFIYACQVTRDKSIALVSTLFFVTTFSHWEAVMWFSASFHMVAAFFVLLALIFWNYWFTFQKKQYYYGTLGCFSFAILTKESAAPLILLLILQQFFLNPIHRENFFL